MLTCRPPYGHLESFAAMFKIATEPMHYDLPAKCSSHVHDFLSQCFIRYLYTITSLYVYILSQLISFHNNISTVQITHNLKQSMRVVFVSHTCCFHLMYASYTCIHMQCLGVLVSTCVALYFIATRVCKLRMHV